MKIIANKIPQISQAFAQIETPCIFRNNFGYVEHSIEWITPFSEEDNGWELNVVIHNLSVNVKAIGLDVFVDDKKLSFADSLNLKQIIAKKFGLSYR